MTESRLRDAFRLRAAGRAGADQLGEALQGLHDGAGDAERARAAALMAEDARAADLGRLLLSLQQDARDLESGQLALRRAQRRWRQLPRVAMGIAAMLALAAVIALPQWRSSAEPTAEVPSGQLIAASSFEGDSAPEPAEQSDSLFSGGFDS